MTKTYLKRIAFLCPFILFAALVFGQATARQKFNSSAIYSGIEVGSKGVKMSVVEIGKNAKNSGAFNILKDTSINTDFISFSPATFTATLNALSWLYTTAEKEYKIPAKRIFTVVSSGVKIQAEKEEKSSWINSLIDSFRLKVNDNEKQVEVVDVVKEARLSHLGIVPETRRYSTFLIDIGSGNTKGGYFPYGNTRDFYLFQLGWGTKSVANAADKKCEDDKSLNNFNKQLYRVLAGAENSEIVYQVNLSGAYPLTDYIAFSGGIAWATATLLHPELIDNAVIPVTFDEVIKFNEKLYSNFSGLSEEVLLENIKDTNPDKAAMAKTIKNVKQVFDQKALMSGAGLMLKIMRQFVSVYETKQFYLVKNGQVGWISAYVDETTAK
jgi:hypothetical protein